jgi:hypothetical protein
MNIFKSLKKIWVGEPLDWHLNLPPTIGPDEVLTTCVHCGIRFVIAKSEKRTTDYCWSCK